MSGVKSLTDEERKDMRFGEYGVDEILHTTCAMNDGIKLAVRVWCPSGAWKSAVDNVTHLIPGKSASNHEKFPTVLEYLPYRKSDWTSERDHRRHPWLTSHGYVVVRADIRGSGDSQGLYHDEYSNEEQEDGCTLIQWISQQPWSNGKVGMYGKSWGGFNGLQIAYRQPPALAAVISLYSTDHRFDEDIHYKGGCMLGNGMLSWAATMFCWDARPPSPAYDKDWKLTWLNRLENAGESCARKWLEHQQYDEYWKFGSVIEDVNKVKAAVLMIGGWHDGYTNAALRMSSSLPNCRTIIGPWSHNWPDEAVPGPNIGFLDECLSWWDQHLKGVKTAASDRERVRWYQCDGLLQPGPSVSIWPGQWMSSEDITSCRSTTSLHLTEAGTLLQCPTSMDNADLTFEKRIKFCGSFGLGCGEWLSFGAPDLPTDQRLTSLYGGVWKSANLENDLRIFGHPVAKLKIRATGCFSQVYCGLCHVFPSGGSRLISYGVLNISSFIGQNNTLETGKEYEVEVRLDCIGYTIPTGHHIQLLLAPGSFPTIWPHKETTDLLLLSGCLNVPTLHPSVEPKHPEVIFEQATPKLPPSNAKVMSKPKFERKLEYGLSDDRRVLRTVTEDGRIYFEDVDTEIEDINEDRYTIVGDDLHSCESFCSRTSIIIYNAKRGKNIHTETHTKSWLTCDKDNFYLKQSVLTKLDGVDFFSRTWSDKIPRNAV